MTRVLHVITSLATGGAEKLMVDLLPRLRDRGLDVELAVFDGTRTSFMDELESRGITVHKLAIGGSVYNPKHIYKLGRLMRCFDVVHTHNTAPQFFAALAGIYNNVKLVTTEHASSNRRRSMPLFRLPDRWMYGRYNRVICIQGKAEQNLREYLGTTSADICTIENGIDVRAFSEAVPCEAFNEIAGPETRKIVMVAAFRWEKDQPTLIRAMSLLPEKFHLFLVGDGVRRQEYEQLVGDLGLSGRVHFLGLRNDVPRLLRSADYVVMSSHFEGLSLSSVEGMSSGHAFLASDVDGLREVVGGAGVLFEHENADQLATEILKLDSDAKEYARVAAKCQERARKFDIETMADRYAAAYNDLV